MILIRMPNIFKSKLFLFLGGLATVVFCLAPVNAEDIPQDNGTEIVNPGRRRNEFSTELQTTGYTESSRIIKDDLTSEKIYKYYYERGKDFYETREYSQSLIEFRKVLDWNHRYRPALKYINKIEDKLTLQQRIEDRKNLKAKLQTESSLAPIDSKQSSLKRKTEKTVKNEIRESAEQEKLNRKKQEKISLNRAKLILETEKKQKKINITAAPRSEPSKLTVSSNQYDTRAQIIYRLDKEDVLDIAVWHYPELSKEIIIRPDGMISFPLAGEIQASGLTLAELKQKLTHRLSEFSKNRFKESNRGKDNIDTEYTIKLEDTLSISVWKVPDLSNDTIVRPDGMISFPLIGDMKAKGKTLVQLDKEITDGLSSYIKNPQVSIMIKSFGQNKIRLAENFSEEIPEVFVTIKKFGGKRVIILGEVNKPGVYTFTSDVRLAEAIGLAGDCTKYALKERIMVIRGDIRNKPQIITSNMTALLKKAQLNENLLIETQDIIYVPRSIVGNINTFIEAITPTIDTIYKGTTTQALIRD